MCHNMPCLINSKLVGGWKYINDKTGEVFNDETDFEEKVDKIINNYSKYTPRKDFLEKYGIIKTGIKFKDFIYEVFGNKINIPKNNIKYITPDYKKIDFVEGSL